MVNARKLPSGNWRARVYSHTDSNGKKIYESFICSTKKEAEMLAAQFANKKHRITTSDLTVNDAIEGYIKAKTGVLSPSTIKGYRQIQSRYFAEIGTQKIKKLTSADLQLFVSDLAATLSAKTIKNIYNLLTASVALYAPDMTFKVTFPMAAKTVQSAPSDEQIKALYEQANDWLKKCIALGAFGGLRRGEIASLKYKDIQGLYVYVHSDMVQDENKKWVYKEMPKTTNSVRMVRLPEKIIDSLGSGSDNEYVICHTPNDISKYFQRLKKKLDIDIRFHDLRHYYASIGAVLGIPDIYMADFGGWRHNSPVLKNVYQGNIQSMADKYSDQLADHFGNII